MPQKWGPKKMPDGTRKKTSCDPVPLGRERMPIDSSDSIYDHLCEGGFVVPIFRSFGASSKHCKQLRQLHHFHLQRQGQGAAPFTHYVMSHLLLGDHLLSFKLCPKYITTRHNVTFGSFLLVSLLHICNTWTAERFTAANRLTALRGHARPFLS